MKTHAFVCARAREVLRGAFCGEFSSLLSDEMVRDGRFFFTKRARSNGYIFLVCSTITFYVKFRGHGPPSTVLHIFFPSTSTRQSPPDLKTHPLNTTPRRPDLREISLIREIVVSILILKALLMTLLPFYLLRQFINMT